MPNGHPHVILAAYDREERIAARPSDGLREETPDVVRHVRPRAAESFVSFVRLDETNADRVIREQIAYFGGTGRSFEWKYFEHDPPGDLLSRLARAGFSVGEEEALMVLDLSRLPADLARTPRHEVRSIQPGVGWNEFRTLAATLWPRHAPDFEEHLRSTLEARPEELEVFLAYLDGVPASAGWLTTTEGSSFAGLYGGGTLPHARGRGLYTALVAARVQAAVVKGRRHATVDAGPMSRPILERLGFVRLTRTRPCVWSPSGGGS